MIEAKVIQDSCNSGRRLTTFLLKYPRMIHSELMTHRAISRNASSSRAIPVEKIIQQVLDEPAMPVYWGKNQKGMQADRELTEGEQELATEIWLKARNDAVEQARALVALGVHKQIANRVLEPFSHITVVASATEWENFFSLRMHRDAQPEFRVLAEAMAEAFRASEPISRVISTDGDYGWKDSWHLPFISDAERALYRPDVLVKCSVARCARVSYLNHDGSQPDIQKDIELHDKLVVQRPAHASPAEHQAFPKTGQFGNFNGWKQYRKTLNDECAHSFPWEAVAK